MPKLRDFEAPSPMDDPTKPYTIPRSRNVIVQGELTGSDSPGTPDQDEKIPDELKSIEAEYFAYNAPNKVEFFDTTLTDFEVFKEAEFTAEELAAIDTPDDPLYRQLVAARRELDQASGIKSRFKMPRPERKILKEIFESTRQAYIESKKPTEEEITPLAKLTYARAKFTESGFALREGSIVGSSRKARIAYQEARDQYEDSLLDYFEIMHQEHAVQMPVNEHDQFITSFKDHERGALAGEEANHYLTQTTDDDKKSYFQKGLERFNNLSRPKKIACTIGAAAVASIGFGAVGGAAAVGGMIGAKFARTYVTGEANRINKYSDMRTKQEHSVLYAGNYELSRQEHKELQEPNDPTELYYDFWDTQSETHERALEKERKRLTKEKRRVYGKAALFSAIPFAGGVLAGTLTELSTSLPHGVVREYWPFSGHDTSPQTAPQPQPPVPDEQPVPAPAPAEAPTAPDTAGTPQISPQSEYLYRDYAGSTIDFSVPAGSSIWSEIEQTVAAAHPGMPSYERRRLVGNLTNIVLEQHPGINPYDVSAGTSFSTSIPS